MENLATIQGQTVGSLLETHTRQFLEDSFGLLQHIRPGSWVYTTDHTQISLFEQYEHLAHVAREVQADAALAAALGTDYIITPDIIVARRPVSEETLNDAGRVHFIEEGDLVAQGSPLRQKNRTARSLILHASISCKWTMRSDRAQNTRTEALNLVRNRKGHLPHMAAVTAEPMPTRLAALALGTGDLDCVYHFALYELQEALELLANEDQLDMLRVMVDGRRLRDISDLPLDLAI